MSRSRGSAGSGSGSGGGFVHGSVGMVVRRMVRGDESTVWVMDRDEQMMDWFSIVRVTNVQTIRWVLGALNGWSSPVSTRQAQAWCARMRTAGYIDRVKLGGAGGSVVWATFAGVGKSKPDLYRQTTRHEIAVSTASARYAAEDRKEL